MVIRQGFTFPELPQICNSVYKIGFSRQNSPKNLDPSYKMDLDFGDCFGTNPLPPYKFID